MQPNETPEITDIGWRDVVVHLKTGEKRKVTGPEQALDLLEYNWPPPYGAVYRRAVLCCAMALDQRLPAAEARQAFFAATFAAGLDSGG